MILTTVNSNHMAAGLARVLKAKVSNQSLAIIENVHAKTISNGLVLSYNNLETSIVTGVQADTQIDEKEFLINPQAFSVLLLLKAENANITISLQGSKHETLCFEYNGNVMKFSHDATDNYPKLPTFKSKVEFTNEDNNFANSLVSALPFTSGDDLRPAMTGVYLTNKVMAATDAHKLVQIDYKLPVKKEVACVVPKTFIQSLAILEEKTEVKINDTFISINDGGTLITSRLIDAKFPQYEAVIPTDNRLHVTFDKTELAKNISLATVLTAKADRKMIFDITKDEYTLRGIDTAYGQEIALKGTCTTDFENRAGVSKPTDKGLKIAFNGNFVMQMLASISTGQVTFDLSKPTTAAVIKDANYLYIIMPLMIHEEETAEETITEQPAPATEVEEIQQDDQQPEQKPKKKKVKVAEVEHLN